MQLLPYTRNCFVCGAHNPHGLRLRFWQVGREVHTEFVAAPHHAGFRDIVHGGLLSTVLDEAMFWAAATQTGRFCLAAELTVRFRRKVTVAGTYRVVAWLVADRGRLLESAAEWRDPAGVVLVRATCKQAPMDGPAMQHAAEDFLPDPATLSAAQLFPALR